MSRKSPDRPFSAMFLLMLQGTTWQSLYTSEESCYPPDIPTSNHHRSVCKFIKRHSRVKDTHTLSRHISSSICQQNIHTLLLRKLHEHMWRLNFFSYIKTFTYINGPTTVAHTMTITSSYAYSPLSLSLKPWRPAHISALSGGRKSKSSRERRKRKNW